MNISANERFLGKVFICIKNGQNLFIQFERISYFKIRKREESCIIVFGIGG
jgi:hypothetical protein